MSKKLFHKSYFAQKHYHHSNNRKEANRPTTKKAIQHVTVRCLILQFIYLVQSNEELVL